MLKKLLSSRVCRVIVHKNAHFINSCSHQQAHANVIQHKNHQNQIQHFSTLVEQENSLTTKQQAVHQALSQKRTIKFYNVSNEKDLEWQTFKPQDRKNTFKDTNSWLVDFDATAYANELLNAKYIELDAGVHCYELSTYLQDEDKDSRVLFTRKHSRALWEEVYARFKTKSNTHAVVTGNPGIGKSRSMAYLLKMLLEDGQLVVYEARKDKNVYIFVPIATQFDEKGNKAILVYTVWRCEENWRPNTCAALKNSNNFYLIDPKERHDPTEVLAHTVIAASPNINHYYEFIKRVGTITYCMPVWEKEEIKAMFSAQAFPFKLTNEELNQRFYMYGGRPRLIVMHPALESRITNAQVSSEILRQGFQCNASELASILFIYKMKQGFKSYVMLNSNIETDVASEFVEVNLDKQYRREVWNLLDPRSSSYAGNSASLGRYFERLALQYLKNGGAFYCMPLLGSGNYNSSLDILNLPRATVIIKCIDKKDFIEKGKLLFDSESNRTLLVPVETQDAIDFMDAKNRVYQATISKSHPINGEAMLNYVNQFGATPENPIHFYFVIVATNPIAKQKFEWNNSVNAEQYNDYVDARVKQFALYLPLLYDEISGVSLQLAEESQNYASTALADLFERKKIVCDVCRGEYATPATFRKHKCKVNKI